jgi:hypothetical protein
MRAVTGGLPRATDGYVLAAMLVAAASGRLLDARGLLPGVHEAVAVRGGGAGWLTALLGAVAVAGVAARRWTRTRRLPITATVAMAGQVAVFLSAEAVARVASGRGPLDPDGVIGALLQAGLAAVLLLALTVAAAVALRRHVVVRPVPQVIRRAAPRAAGSTGRRLAALVEARGPPVVSRC